MDKAWFSGMKFAAMLALLALASLGLLFIPLAAYAEDPLPPGVEKPVACSDAVTVKLNPVPPGVERPMGCSDTVTVKLISPESTNIPWVPIAIGIAILTIVLGLVLVSRRNGRKAKHRHAS